MLAWSCFHVSSGDSSYMVRSLTLSDLVSAGHKQASRCELSSFLEAGALLERSAVGQRTPVCSRELRRHLALFPFCYLLSLLGLRIRLLFIQIALSFPFPFLVVRTEP